MDLQVPGLITWRLCATGCHLINLLASDIFKAPSLALLSANRHTLVNLGPDLSHHGQVDPQNGPDDEAD